MMQANKGQSALMGRMRRHKKRFLRSPQKEIRRTSAMADDPKTDMTRYYYRPGTTEPELRPEIAAAEAQAASKAEAETAEEPKPLRGKLPEDFPGGGALEMAGVTTYAGVRRQLDSLE